LSSVADSLAPGIVLAQAIGRLGNYFNQELFGAPTTMPWGLDVYVRTPGGVAGIIPVNGNCEFPTEYVKATPELLCGTYQPTFLYELLWCLGVAAFIVWADKRWQLGGGRVFALYVAGYTLGRGWIEMLRIDTVELDDVGGLRFNVWTSIVLFVVALVYFVVSQRLRPGQETEVYDEGYGPQPALAPAGEGAEGATPGPDEADPDRGAHDPETRSGPPPDA